MADILLSVEVQLIQKEIRRLSTLLRNPDKFKYKVTYTRKDVEGNDTQEITSIDKIIGDYLKTAAQSLDFLNTKIGDGKAFNDYDETLSVIENISVTIDNVNAAINRISANEKQITTLGNTKADKDTTQAIQDDLDNLINAILSQDV